MAQPSADHPVPFALEKVRALIGKVLRPGQFFVRTDLPLAWQPPVFEEISWEIFRGRLHDPAQTILLTPRPAMTS